MPKCYNNSRSYGKCVVLQELASAAKAKAERSAEMQALSERLSAANKRLAALEAESSDTAERALIAQVESDQLYSAGELQVLLSSHACTCPMHAQNYRLRQITYSRLLIDSPGPAIPTSPLLRHASCSRTNLQVTYCASVCGVGAHSKCSRCTSSCGD